MGLDPKQLLRHVVRPALATLDLPGGELAEKLVMGTAAQESDGFRYIHQLGKGPALSLWQIEPATASDTLARCPSGLFKKVYSLLPEYRFDEPRGFSGLLEDLPGNLYLGAALCRLVYYMKPFAMPELSPLLETPNMQRDWCSKIWKKYYNTIKGAGTEAQFIDHWNESNLDRLWP